MSQRCFDRLHSTRRPAWLHVRRSCPAQPSLVGNSSRRAAMRIAKQPEIGNFDIYNYLQDHPPAAGTHAFHPLFPIVAFLTFLFSLTRWSSTMKFSLFFEMQVADPTPDREVAVFRNCVEQAK